MSSKQGVLLINLGSPDSTKVSDVRKYLRQFLMDGRVIDVPYLLRWCIVNLAILPTRPAQSAEAYQTIWLPEGSPLVVTSKKVRERIQQRVGDDLVIELAMRYQNPSVDSALEKLKEQGVTDVLVVPLFPHYASSSYESAAVHAHEQAAKIAPGLKLKTLPPFYVEPEYIGALAASASADLAEPFDHLLFSFHGIPERHLRNTDPTCHHCLKVKNCCESVSPAHATCYRHQCFTTVNAFIAWTGIPKEKVSVSFQSRLGNDPWLKPYTDFEFERLPKEGVKNLLVMCPAFVSDCLETLEEIAMRGKETFEKAGGEKFKMIPCLNDHPAWLDGLTQIILRHL